MKNFLLPLITILLITSCSNKNENLIKDYLKECNDYNFENASQYLDPNYKEKFIDGTLEIQNLEQLETFIGWREIMESESKILSLECLEDTVITTEEFYNLMDEILERKPRTFKIIYVIKDGKILNSILDTLPGFTQTLEFNNKKFNEFKDYCSQNGLEDGAGMTRNEAIALKKSLTIYKNRR